MNLSEKLAQLSDSWKPMIVGEWNGQIIKLFKFQGPHAQRATGRKPGSYLTEEFDDEA